MDSSGKNVLQVSTGRQEDAIKSITERAQMEISSTENQNQGSYVNENGLQASPGRHEEGMKFLTARARTVKSNTEHKNQRSYVNENDNMESVIINSQFYGFSMRRKRNPTTSSIQTGTAVRNFTQYNDLQSSRCQSNISLDSLLTQYKQNNVVNKPSIPTKASCNKVHLH